MNPEFTRSIRTGLWASLYLVGPIILTFIIAFGLQVLPFHIDIAQVAPLFLAIYLTLCAGGGWLWGRKLAKNTASPDPVRLAWAGALSFGPLALAAALGLGMLEQALVERARIPIPIHVLFAILFTGANLIVAALMGVAYCIALRVSLPGWRLPVLGGLAGAFGFLLIDLGLDLLGRRVGGPNAAATATMITTMLAGNIGSAFASGAVSVYLIRQILAARVLLSKQEALL